MTAVFLKERWSWIDSDLCWRYERDRQSRERLFEVGRKNAMEAAGSRGTGRNPKRSRKGFGYYHVAGYYGPRQKSSIENSLGSGFPLLFDAGDFPSLYTITTSDT